jgi:hypothetical protein
LLKRAFPLGFPVNLKAMAVALILIFASAWTGGMLNGEITILESFLAIEGLLAIFGLTIFIKAILTTGWSKFFNRVTIISAVVLLICSLVGYFLPIERLITMGPLTYFDPTRLTLIWPTKLMMSWAGQIGWGHANHAGLIFGISFILIIEHLASGEARLKIAWWLIALGFGTALFLTGSRGALLMIVPCLPLIAIRRGWVWSARCTALCVAALTVGVGVLTVKRNLIQTEALKARATSEVTLPSVTPPEAQPSEINTEPPPLPPIQQSEVKPADVTPLPPPPPPPDHHLGGLVKRGSAGRIGAYLTLRDELNGSLWLGRGLSQNNRPLAHLLNEHSSYLATLRGAGIIGLICHTVLLAISAASGIRLYLQGTRWPLILLTAVATAILFDRGSVFLVNASYEFLFHWVAVLIPVLLDNGRKQIRCFPQPSSPDSITQ